MLEKHNLKYRIEWNLSGKPLLTKPGKLLNPITSAIEKITEHANIQAETGGSTSDGNFTAMTDAKRSTIWPVKFNYS